MKRGAVRSILVVVGLLTLAVIAEAQQPKKVPRIGYLSLRSGFGGDDEAFRQGLRELGYTEGQNIVVEWRFVDGKSERYHDFAMVCEWGMSEKLGPMTFGKKEEEIFLGRDFTQKSDYSKSTAIEIDAEVRRIIQESYHRAKDLLATNLRLLHKVAEKLLEKEVLDGSEIDTIVRAFGANGGEPFTPSSAAAIA